MKKTIKSLNLLQLILFCISLNFTSVAHAKDEKKEGITDLKLILGTSLNVGGASFSVNDAYDKNNYVGDFGGGLGIGGQALLFLPLKHGFQIGGNFDWMYSSHTSTLYDIYVFQPSAGPAIRWTMEKTIDLIAYFNFTFGWVTGEGLSSCTKILCPGGNFNVSMSGTTFGFRGLYPINDHFSVGPFVAFSSQTMNSVPYKFADSGKYRTLEADIGVSYSQYGVSVVWYPF